MKLLLAVYDNNDAIENYFKNINDQKYLNKVIREAEALEKFINFLDDECYIDICGIVKHKKSLLESVLKYQPDTLILSHNLPGEEDLREIIAKLTSSNNYPVIRIIYLYGKDDDKKREYINFLIINGIYDYYVGDVLTPSIINDLLIQKKTRDDVRSDIISVSSFEAVSEKVISTDSKDNKSNSFDKEKFIHNISELLLKINNISRLTFILIKSLIHKKNISENVLSNNKEKDENISTSPNVECTEIIQQSLVSSSMECTENLQQCDIQDVQDIPDVREIPSEQKIPDEQEINEKQTINKEQDITKKHKKLSNYIEKRKLKKEIKESIFGNTTFVISICALKSGAGCSHIAISIAYFIKSQLKKSVCIVDLKETENIDEIRGIEIFHGINFFHLYDQYNYIILDIGIYDDIVLKTIKLAQIKIMVCLYNEIYVEKLGNFILDNENTDKWKYIFNYVTKKQIKKVRDTMEKYDYWCMPINDGMNFDDAIVSAFLKILKGDRL